MTLETSSEINTKLIKQFRPLFIEKVARNVRTPECIEKYRMNMLQIGRLLTQEHTKMRGMNCRHKMLKGKRTRIQKIGPRATLEHWTVVPSEQCFVVVRVHSR